MFVHMQAPLGFMQLVKHLCMKSCVYMSKTVQMYTRIHVHLYICLHGSVYMPVNVSLYTRLGECMHACVHIHVSA